MGMPLELIEDAYGDDRNAAALAAAAELAYLPEEAGKVGFREILGMDARLIAADNTQVYVATNADHVVVAFRGSEAPTSLDGVKDWLLTDAVNLLIVPEGDLGTDFMAAGVGARFHKGFMAALGLVWEPLFAAVQTELKNDRPLWLTGHSLGGALALLAAWRFQRRFVSVHQVYTFGAPMIGNTVAAAAFDGELARKVYRYVNEADLVPKLPAASLIANAYGNVMAEVALGAAAISPAAEALKAVASQAVDGLVRGHLIDAVWAVVQERLHAHDIGQYKALVAARGRPQAA
jgi:hypothetical protein